MDEAERFDWLMAMDDGKIIATGNDWPAARLAGPKLRRVTTRSASTTNSAGGHRSWSLLEVNGCALRTKLGSRVPNCDATK